MLPNRPGWKYQWVCASLQRCSCLDGLQKSFLQGRLWKAEPARCKGNAQAQLPMCLFLIVPEMLFHSWKHTRRHILAYLTALDPSGTQEDCGFKQCNIPGLVHSSEIRK